MTAKKIGVSIPDWIEHDILADSKNRSARITELIIKGYLAEKEKVNLKNTSDSHKDMPISFNPADSLFNSFILEGRSLGVS